LDESNAAALINKLAGIVGQPALGWALSAAAIKTRVYVLLRSPLLNGSGYSNSDDE
jgi:hypothetical protein